MKIWIRAQKVRSESPVPTELARSRQDRGTPAVMGEGDLRDDAESRDTATSGQKGRTWKTRVPAAPASAFCQEDLNPSASFYR